MKKKIVLCAIALGLLIAGAAGARADIEVAITPNTTVDFNEAFSLLLSIPSPGTPFNTYEAVITFPADLIHFVPAVPPQLNEGSTMTDPCGFTFLSFTADTDSAGVDTLRITHSLLCAGQNVTGPGTLYTLDFLSRDVDGFGWVAVSSARFASAGVEVGPVVKDSALVVVGSEVAVPGAESSGLLPPARPNPFRSSTSLEFVIEQAGDLRVDVFTVAGRRVRQLMERAVGAGERVDVVWDGSDDTGASVAPGTYFLRVRDDRGSRTQRVVRVR